MLEAVGVTPNEERLYSELLAQPRAAIAELAAAAGLTPAQARHAVAGLSRAGLVSRRGGSNRLVPAPPDVAVEALIARRAEELERARLAAAGLVEDFRRGSRRNHSTELIEVITGREAIYQRSVQLLYSARDEILMLDKPPYVGPTENTLEYELLARGLRWRAIYAPESLELPDRIEQLRRLRQAGEQARISPGLPMKLAIADSRLALLPLTTDASEDEQAILVHPCSLLTTLTTLFEILWERGIPPSDLVVERSVEADADHTLLMLLAAGTTDEAIARKLGISLRTARRRLARLMRQHNVQTRFQLGLVAGRGGLTGEP